MKLSHGRLKELINKLMTRHPHLKDNPRRLTAAIWSKELEIGGMSAQEFLSAYALDEVTDVDTILKLRAEDYDSEQEDLF